MAIPPGSHADPLDHLTPTRTSTRPPHPLHPAPCPYRTQDAHFPIRSSNIIRVLPILVVKTHHRAPALACSSTLLAQVKNVLGRELRICIVFRLEGPGPIIGSLRSGTFTLFYMQGKGMGGVP